MRKRLACVPIKCMIAITSASLSMSIAAGLVAAPIVAYAESYDLVNGSVDVYSDENGDRTVTQDNNTHSETEETVVTYSGSTPTSNSISIESHGEGENAAKVTIENVNINTEGTIGAAISTTGTGDVVIEIDGTNNVQSEYSHAGIEKGNSGNLTIQNEKGDSPETDNLTAGGGDYGAGIGSGIDDNVDNITINDCNIIANGGKGAAGIGGGHDGSANNITINGGNITSTGGIGAAGIGGGQFGSANNIIINDATITSTGGDGAAGIGGTNNSNADTITINGGDITAIGGIAAAGIGCGFYGNVENITISGGKVTAIGGEGASGIGGAFQSSLSNVIICGSSFVSAAGGSTYTNMLNIIGEGPGIGIGPAEYCTIISGDTPFPGTPIDPDISKLLPSGKIYIYPAGTTLDDIKNNRVAPIATTIGTYGTSKTDNNTSANTPVNTNSSTTLVIPEQTDNIIVRPNHISDHGDDAVAHNDVSAPQTGSLTAAAITDMIRSALLKNPNAELIELDFGRNICLSPTLVSALFQRPDVAKDCRFFYKGETYVLHIPKTDTSGETYQTCLDAISKEKQGFAGFLKVNDVFEVMGTTITIG